MRLIGTCLLVALSACVAARAHVVASHPRIFVTGEGLPDLARRSTGPLREDYALVKRAADAAVSRSRGRRRSG